MAVSIYDDYMRSANHAMQRWDLCNTREQKEGAIRDVESAANEFEAAADEWRQWAEEKSNQLYEEEVAAHDDVG